MTSLGAWTLLCGLALGLGLWTLVAMLPRLSRPKLASRVAPYVRDVSPGARELLARQTVDPLPVFGLVLTPVISALRAGLSAVLGNPADTRHRLRQAGSTLTVEDFRSQQLAWGAAGAGLGVVVAIVIAGTRGIPLIAQIVVVAVFTAGGVVAKDYLLQRKAKARLARMDSELPTVLEFLTLSLSAGEGILDAIRRVSRVSHGELAGELANVVAEVNTGIAFADSITRVASDLRLVPFTRTVDQLTGALERGTPIVEVLRAQAQDSRDDAKRSLLEVAGKKEVAMLVPLVFLILPVTVAFAIFPGIVVLQMGF